MWQLVKAAISQAVRGFGRLLVAHPVASALLLIPVFIDIMDALKGQRKPISDPEKREWLTAMENPIAKEVLQRAPQLTHFVRCIVEIGGWKIADIILYEMMSTQVGAEGLSKIAYMSPQEQESWATRAVKEAKKMIVHALGNYIVDYVRTGGNVHYPYVDIGRPDAGRASFRYTKPGEQYDEELTYFDRITHPETIFGPGVPGIKLSWFSNLVGGIKKVVSKVTSSPVVQAVSSFIPGAQTIVGAASTWAGTPTAPTARKAAQRYISRVAPQTVPHYQARESLTAQLYGQPGPMVPSRPPAYGAQAAAMPQYRPQPPSMGYGRPPSPPQYPSYPSYGAPPSYGQQRQPQPPYRPPSPSPYGSGRPAPSYGGYGQYPSRPPAPQRPMYPPRPPQPPRMPQPSYPSYGTASHYRPPQPSFHSMGGVAGPVPGVSSTQSFYRPGAYFDDEEEVLDACEGITT
jgi:hypothetical protein